MKRRVLVSSLAAAALCLGLGTMASAQVYTETFDGLTVGNLNQDTGWTTFTTGPGAAPYFPSVTAGAGLNGTQGLTPADAIFNWTAHPFAWTNLAVGDKVRLGLDFQASAAGRFDDDRLAWTTTGSDLSSNYEFGIQFDNSTAAGNFIGAYWKNAYSSGTSVRTNLATIATVTNSGWYRGLAEFTKLADTSSRIDVTLTELDVAGNPTSTVFTASVADTGALGGTAPGAGYFGTAASALVPSYKNYNAIDGAADNAVFGIVAGVPEPACFGLLALAGLVGLRRRH